MYYKTVSESSDTLLKGNVSGQIAVSVLTSCILKITSQSVLMRHMVELTLVFFKKFYYHPFQSCFLVPNLMYLSNIFKQQSRA